MQATNNNRFFESDKVVWKRMDFYETSRVLSEFANRNYQEVEDVARERYPHSYLHRPGITVPFVHDLVKALSIYYRRPPKRDFVGLNLEQKQLVESLYKSLKINNIMKDLSEKLVHQRTVVGIILPKPGSYEWTIKTFIPADCQVVLSDPLNNDDPKSVGEWKFRVPLKSDAKTITFGELVLTPTKAVYRGGSNQEVGVYSPDGSNPFGSNYPIFVARLGSPPPGDFFCDLPDDLVSAQIEICLGLSDAVHSASYNSWGQRYMSGADRGMATELPWGPDTVIGLSEGQEMGVVSASGNVGPYLDTIGLVMRYERLLNSLPETPMRGNAMTGIARLMERIDQDGIREDMVSALNEAEQGIYQAINRCISWGFGAVKPNLPDAEINITHQDPPIPEDPAQAAMAKEIRIRLAIENPIDIIAEERGVTYDEAKVIFQRNKSELNNNGQS